VEIATNVLHRCLPILVELAGKGDFSGVVRKFWPSSLPPPRPGSLDACLGSLPDDVPLKLGQCPEDVEDQLPPEVVVSICSVRLLKPIPLA
jgi:hypothetical protein